MTASNEFDRTGRETILRARWVFAMDRPPIRDGYLRIVEGRIVEVNSGQPDKSPLTRVIDLLDHAILPRLVNAHTHLEFSDCPEPIGQPGMPLADWIGDVIAARGASTAGSRDQAISRGVAESYESGVGWIGDITTPPSHFPSPLPLKVISYAEVLGLSDHRAEERLTAANEQRRLSHSHGEWEPGFSPHAPYSTRPETISACIRQAQATGAGIQMHVAESPDERELLETGKGRFAETLEQLGLSLEGIFPYLQTAPIASLIEQLAAAPRASLIHGNDLSDEEIAVIARHPNLTVVYCPRTHDFFRYPAHPVAKLLRCGVRVALGTDSRASNPDLSVWKEVQFLLRRRADLDPQTVLKMATHNGGESLAGNPSQIGSEWDNAGRLVEKITGVKDLAVVRTQAATLDQVWRDFADNDLSCNLMDEWP